MLCLAMLLLPACVIIEDGEVGVKKSFGSISDDPVGQGPIIQIPVVRTVETWNTKLQEIKESAAVPSSEGLIVGLDASLLFRVNPADAPMIRKTIGPSWVYVDKLVVPYFRSGLRDVVSGYEVKDIYSVSGRGEIAGKLKEFLVEELSPRGIIVQDVLLRDVKLPQRFKESIERKLTAEQKVQEKQFELDQAVKDAEIEIARAKGAAEAQEIVRSTLSDSYLQYLWIKTLNENPNVIYVSTEANMPIVRTRSAE
jgi:regulator of protease activity HflC (stomatin/prohibitin superfamily)